jgi:hypothetical protein
MADAADCLNLDLNETITALGRLSKKRAVKEFL